MRDSDPDFSTLAGPFDDVPAQPYRVQYQKLPSRRPIRTVLLTITSPLLVLGFLVWLLQPSHWKTHHDVIGFVVLSVIMTALLTIMELTRFINVFSLCRATLCARNPIPVLPDPQQRVAYITTFVPSKEPIGMLERTLRAACEMYYDGYLEIFVLDEGDSPAVRLLCRDLGVSHFTRKGVKSWNQKDGFFEARTKHGNINAWLAKHGHRFDIVCGVDPDHVPKFNFCERLLGYFRDERVGFAISPQVYGNSQTNLVARMAESQQFLFHAIVQRAGNRTRSAMFVGTNYAFRVAAIESIGGIQASITEDAMTGAVLHQQGWESVYTPDVLAVGEGPSNWTDYFTQQHRWARGTMEIWRRHLSLVRKVPRRQRFNYVLMFLYYPTAAISWMIGIVNCMLYLLTGITGIESSSTLWIVLYADVAFFQTVLYVWNKRYNVSPHEPAGSIGFAGMLASALAAPLFTKAFFDAAIGNKAKFVVTPKGSSASPDRMWTFRYHWFWAGCIVVSMALGLVLFSHNDITMWAWSCVVLAICVLPWVLSHCMEFFRPSPAKVKNGISIPDFSELEEVKT